MEWMKETVKKLHQRDPRLKARLGDAKTTFAKALENFYSDRVIPDADDEYDEVTERTEGNKGEIYNMRTIRARHGTDWVK